jgi:hypothetical protein
MKKLSFVEKNSICYTLTFGMLVCFSILPGFLLLFAILKEEKD